MIQEEHLSKLNNTRTKQNIKITTAIKLEHQRE